MFVRFFVVQGLALLCATGHTLCEASSLAEMDISVFLSTTWPWHSGQVSRVIERATEKTNMFGTIYLLWLDAWFESYMSRYCSCVGHICSNFCSLHLGPATAAAAGHTGHCCHECNSHCGRAKKNIIITASDSTILVMIENRDSQMKVKRMKKAPRSIGLALGRPCSLTHILLRRFSASSWVFILTE